MKNKGEEKKEYKHDYSGIKMSEELSEEDKKYVKAMYGWIDSAQRPMLTERIIILANRIKKLNCWTAIFSIILIILTIILIILTCALVAMS